MALTKANTRMIDIPWTFESASATYQVSVDTTFDTLVFSNPVEGAVSRVVYDDVGLEVRKTSDANTIEPGLFLRKDSTAGAAAMGLAKIQWRMTNDAGTKDVDAGRIDSVIIDATAGSETARMSISPQSSGNGETQPAMSWQNGIVSDDGTASPVLNFHGFGTYNLKELYVDNVKVVDAQKTGWAAATGTATRTTFATGSVTTAQLAERVKALIDDLISHGLIGT